MVTRTKGRLLSYVLSAILPLGSLLLPTTTQAAVVVNTTVPFAALVLIPCAPDLVLVSGGLHVLITATFDNGGGAHFKFHAQPQGISGVGLSGAQYRATGVTQEHINFHDSLAFEDTFVNNFRIIGQGPGNNFLVHQTFHVTVNANGDVTATVLNTSVECR